MSRPPNNPQQNAQQHYNMQGGPPPRPPMHHHHYPSAPDLHHLHGIDPALIHAMAQAGGHHGLEALFPPGAAPSFQPPPQLPPPPQPSMMSRKPSLLAGYHNSFSSSPERGPPPPPPTSNERLINNAMQINQQQHRFSVPQPPPPPNQSSSSRANNSAMAEAAAAAIAAALPFGDPSRGGPFDSTNAATAAALAAANAAANAYMMMEQRQNGRPEEKFLRAGGKHRPMSPNEMMMRGAPAPKIRAQSPADEKFTSPSRGQPQPGFSPAMMAAAVANVIQSSVAMNIRPGSPSQLAQFIHQQLNQSPKQPPPPPQQQQQQLPPPKKEMVVQPMLSLSGMFPPPPPPPMQPATPAKTPQPPSIQSASSSSLSSSSSCSYVPQVEAISPTPEDQKENSCVQLMKDKIIGEIEKVEKDLASTQYQVEMLKKKTIEIEEEQSKKPIDENDVEKLIQVSKTMTLAEKIYQENRKKAEESHRNILKPLNQTSNDSKPALQPTDDDGYDSIPFYQEFTDTKLSHEIRYQFDTVMKRRLIRFFKRQVAVKKQRERSLTENYDELHTKWQKKVDRFENSIKKRQKDGKSREFYEKVFPEIRKQREERERLIQKQSQPTPVLEANATTTPAVNEPNPIEEERKRVYQLAVVPPLCVDARLRKYKFINNNGYVQDPVALFKSVKNEIFWNEKEKEIFLDKLVTFGKNFELIATFLEKKSVQDCIEYYYLTKKKINYKMLIRKNQRRRKKDINKTNANNTNNTAATSIATSNGSSSQLINSNQVGATNGSNGISK